MPIKTEAEARQSGKTRVLRVQIKKLAREEEKTNIYNIWQRSKQAQSSMIRKMRS